MLILEIISVQYDHLQETTRLAFVLVGASFIYFPRIDVANQDLQKGYTIFQVEQAY